MSRLLSLSSNRLSNRFGVLLFLLLAHGFTILFRFCRFCSRISLGLLLIIVNISLGLNLATKVFFFFFGPAESQRFNNLQYNSIIAFHAVLSASSV